MSHGSRLITRHDKGAAVLANRLANDAVRANRSSVSPGRLLHWHHYFNRVAGWLFVATLAWVQFPLGSHPMWATDVLFFLVAAVWLLWLPTAIIQVRVTTKLARRVVVPICLAATALVWSYYQSVTWSAPALHAAIWQVASDAVGHKISGTISINPSATTTEAIKLLCYSTICWLSYAFCQDRRFARTVLLSIAMIGFCYAIYGVALRAGATSQWTLLEGVISHYQADVTGGFINKNNFATFNGVCILAVIGIIVHSSKPFIVADRGARPLAHSTLQYIFGPGALWIVALIALFWAQVAADSRAGLLATLCGIFAFGLFGMLSPKKPQTIALTAVGLGATFALFLVLFFAAGSTLEAGFDTLIQTRGSQDLRVVMWSAAERMIAAHPWEGVGLGCFADAYNLVADRFVPYAVDHAHNDYLELLAGLGIPAAAAWLMSIGWLVVTCISGIYHRRRDQVYCVVASSASVLVAFHSAFDFSLQIPAVAVLYASMLGLGVAQSRSSEHRGHDLYGR